MSTGAEKDRQLICIGSTDVGVKKQPFDDNAEGEMTARGEFVKAHGYSWPIASVTLIGSMAGGGIVALPTAVQMWTLPVGIGVCILMAALGALLSVLLGRCWSILLRLWPEYRTHCRNPYAEMGYRAMGTPMKRMIGVLLFVSQLCASMTFALLAAKNINDFVSTISESRPSVCWTLPVITVVLLPVTLLKSPKEFWWMVVGAMLSTIAAVVLILVGAASDHSACVAAVAQPSFNIQNALTGLSTIAFAFCGHTTYPSMQVDMKRPAQWTRVSIISYAFVLTLYIIVVLVFCLTYGDSLRESLINSVQTRWIQQTVNMAIGAHCLSIVTLILNPAMQQAEAWLAVPQAFGVGRVAVRSAIMLIVLFLAESIPDFSSVLGLLGASAVTLMCIIFPALFWLFLAARERKAAALGASTATSAVTFREMIQLSDDKSLMVFICAAIIALGIVCAVWGTYAAIDDILGTRFQQPCYLRPFISGHVGDAAASTSTNCCGAYQNISVQTGQQCNPPDLHFYD